MLTYIGPCGWCSSSISSLKCPSNVDKSNEPYPDLSTYSRLSSNESLLLSRQSLQSNQKTAFSTATSIIRSTLPHPHDYHSRKRIDELHERMDEVQIRSFLQFINYHLSLKKPSENLHVNDFLADFANGHILIDLIEILSSTKLKREHGRTRFHSLSNIQYVLDYLKLRLQHINISSQDIVSGNRKQILALLWIIMKVFDFPAFRLMNKNCFREKTLLTSGQDRSLLLNWLNHLLNQCLINQPNLPQDFYLHTWINGDYLSFILKYLLPISEKYLTMQSFDYLKRMNSVDKFDHQRLEICLDLSNYCFHTTTVINDQDKTETSLIQYFSDLQKNIFQLVKSDQIGKLVQINPYIKQILQTIEHSSHKININEQYLVCIEDEEKANRKSDSDFVARSEEHSKQVNGIVDEFDEQIALNESVEHLVTKTIEEAVEQIITNNDEREQIRLLSFNEKDELLDQTVPIFNNRKSSDHINEEEEKYPSVIFDEVTSIVPVVRTENATIELPLSKENIQQPVVNDHRDQLQSETPQEQVVASNDEDKQTLDQSEQIQTIKEEEQSSSVLEEDAEQIVPEVTEAKSLLITPQEAATVPYEEPLNEKTNQLTVEIPSETLAPSEEKDADTLNDIHIGTSLTSDEKFEELTALRTKFKPVSITTEKIAEEPVTALKISNPVLVADERIEEKPAKPTTNLPESQPVSITAEKIAEDPVTALKISKPVLVADERIEQKPAKPSTPLTESIPASITTDKIEKNLEEPIVPRIESKPISTTTEEIEKRLEEPITTLKESKPVSATTKKLEEPVAALKETKVVSAAPEKIEAKPEESMTPFIDPTLISPTLEKIEEKLEKPTTTHVKPKPVSISTKKVEEKLEEPVVSRTESKPVSILTEKFEEPVAPRTQSKPVLVAAEKTEEKLEQPTTTHVKSKQISVTTEKVKDKLEEPATTSRESKVVLAAAENFPQATSKVSLNTFVNKPVEQPSKILTQNELVYTEKKVNPSQATTSGEKSTMLPDKQLEKPVVREVQQQRPFTPHGQNNQSTYSNKKFVNPPKKSIATASSIQDNSHSRHELRLQPNTIVKEPEQRKNAIEIPVKSVVTASPICSRYYEAINQPVQSIASTKKQEQATVSKKKVPSPLPSNGTPKQSIIITEEIRPVPTVITLKQSEASSTQQQQSNVVKEEPNLAANSNGEAKKSRNKNKKSRRSNAKKANAKNNSAKTETSLQSIVDNGEEKEESEGSVHDEPTSSPVDEETVIEVHTAPSNNANSSASRSRRSRKKKTTATVNTTVVEKSSSPASTNRLTPNRNLLVVVKECIHDRKILAFKCVIILVCLCLSILILVFPHK